MSATTYTGQLVFGGRGFVYRDRAYFERTIQRMVKSLFDKRPNPYNWKASDITDRVISQGVNLDKVLDKKVTIEVDIPSDDENERVYFFYTPFGKVADSLGKVPIFWSGYGLNVLADGDVKIPHLELIRISPRLKYSREQLTKRLTKEVSQIDLPREPDDYHNPQQAERYLRQLREHFHEDETT